ncbi:MAG TPA: hypothetical protein VFY12_03700 [Arenimonas sp.]|nr:hypothetical protein [Arenimonas sp.]
MSRLVEQIAEALQALSACAAAPALIGGLALAAHGVIRATQDVDLLLDSDDVERAHEALLGLHYRCEYRSSEAANYRRGDDALDLMYAHRPLARRLLAEAQARETPIGRVRVISAEGLIACKLQGWVNNPARTLDLEDIRNLLVANAGALDLDEVRGYFELFDRESLFDELLAESTR